MKHGDEYVIYPIKLDKDTDRALGELARTLARSLAGLIWLVLRDTVKAEGPETALTLEAR